MKVGSESPIIGRDCVTGQPGVLADWGEAGGGREDGEGRPGLAGGGAALVLGVSTRPGLMVLGWCG